MLHLKFALNLERLADEMIEAVKHAWISPFQSPIIIFPDPKLEQWFRLHWVKRCGTLANFNSMMIDRFLMKILCPDDNTKKKLNADLLRNVIWATLYAKNESGEQTYREFGDEVIRYLEADGKLDEQHLFDLCNKMASLFLEYETSRPAGFIKRGANLSEDATLAEGILERWQQENLRDFFDGSEREKWQRALYSKIFHEQNGEPSILTRAFEAMNKRKNEGKQIPFDTIYLTIPFLFKDCMANHGNFHCEQFMGESGPLPVFIFGLTGMGQFYRMILQKFAEEHEVFAFIQNPCMEFWEDATTAKPDRHSRWQSRKGLWQGENGPVPESVRKRLHFGLDDTVAPEENDDIEQGMNATDENALLCYWGKSGRDNIKLWCQATDYDFEFEDFDSGLNSGAEAASDLPKDTLLHKVQYMIANRKNELPELLEGILHTDSNEATSGSAVDKSFTLTAAPTREREMEMLHTSICKLLSMRNANGKPVNRISDILVFAPNLDDYRTAIFQAFDQNSDEGLHVPFSIVDSPAKTSLTSEALKALFAMQKDGSIGRAAFFALIRNPVVQKTRHITEQDVAAWEAWIENTNTFRTRGGKDDWIHALRRLLIARFSSHLVDDSLPYADMMSADSRTLNKFANCIDELEAWISLAQQNASVTPTILDTVATTLGNWVAMPYPPEGFGGETIIYQNVTACLENLRFQYDAGATSISWECVSQTLQGSAQSSEYSCGNLFVNGITFSKFLPNRIIPVKHLFFIGADSASFPGSKTQNTLDLRKAVSPWPGDDSPVAKRRYAFLCQLMSTSESFHISYMNQNIVKDEELYPSSVVSDLQNFFKNAIRTTAKNAGHSISANDAKEMAKKLWPQIEIPLDETRAYSDLFTSKEFRNKFIYNGLVNSIDAPANHSQYAPPSEKKPERVSIYQLREFLCDPFEFRISQMMNKDNDEAEDPSDNVFEPIDFDRLEQNALLKSMVAQFVECGKNDELAALKQDLRHKSKLPDGDYGEKLWNVATIMSDFILQQMQTVDDSPINNKQDWIFNDRIELAMEQPDGTKWTLQGTTGWSNKSRDKIAGLTTSSLSGKVAAKTYKLSKYISQYVTALAFIAEKNSEQKQTVDISIYSSANESEKPATAQVQMTSSEAKAKLQALYESAFVEKYSKAVPADMLNEQIKNFADYSEKLAGAWKYFDKRHLFDMRKDVGFDPDAQFDGETGQWATASKHQKDLIEMEIHPLNLSARGAKE